MSWKKKFVLFLSVVAFVSYWQLEEYFSIVKFDQYPRDTISGNGSVIFSPDGTSFSFVTHNKEWKIIIVKDGEEINTCESSNHPIYSPNSESFSYLCKKWYSSYSIIRDWVESKEYPNLLATSIEYSPDGKRLSFIAYDDEWNAYMIENDEEFGPYDNIDFHGTYSEDGSSFVFTATKWEKNVIVKDGKEVPLETGSELGNINPHYSSEGHRFAYSYKKGEMNFLVANNNTSEGYEDISVPNFLSGNNSYVFVGRKGGQYYLVIQSNWKWEEVWPYDNMTISYYSNKLSSNSEHFVYLAEKDGRKIVLIDGKPSWSYDQIPDFLILSRSSSEAPEWRFWYNMNQFLYSKTGEDLVFSALKSNKEILVKNGVEIDKYDRAYAPQLSSDGKYFLFLAEKNNQTILVKNGVEIPLNGYKNSPPHGYNGILISPDDSKYALLLISATEENKVVLLESAMENNDISLMKRMTYDNIKNATYSKLSNKLIFIGTDGEESFVVRDWKKSEWYNGIEQGMFSENNESLAFITNNSERKILIQYSHKISTWNMSKEVTIEPLNSAEESKNWLKNATYINTGPFISISITISLLLSFLFFILRKRVNK